MFFFFLKIRYYTCLACKNALKNSVLKNLQTYICVVEHLFFFFPALLIISQPLGFIL